MTHIVIFLAQKNDIFFILRKTNKNYKLQNSLNCFMIEFSMNKLKSILNIKKINKKSITWYMDTNSNSTLAEIIGKSNYDWAAIDMEHGSISIHQLPDLFRARIRKHFAFG